MRDSLTSLRHLVFSGLYKLLCVIIIFFSALASILRAWLDQCPEDFQEPPSYPSLHRVLGFLQKAMPGSEPMRRAQSLLEQLRVQASLENETEGHIRLLLIILSILSNFLCIHVCSVFLCLQKHLLSVCCRRLSVHQPFLHWGR